MKKILILITSVSALCSYNAIYSMNREDQLPNTIYMGLKKTQRTEDGIDQVELILHDELFGEKAHFKDDEIRQKIINQCKEMIRVRHNNNVDEQNRLIGLLDTHIHDAKQRAQNNAPTQGIEVAPKNLKPKIEDVDEDDPLPYDGSESESEESNEEDIPLQSGQPDQPNVPRNQGPVKEQIEQKSVEFQAFEKSTKELPHYLKTNHVITELNDIRTNYENLDQFPILTLKAIEDFANSDNNQGEASPEILKEACIYYLNKWLARSFNNQQNIYLELVKRFDNEVQGNKANLYAQHKRAIIDGLAIDAYINNVVVHNDQLRDQWAPLLAGTKYNPNQAPEPQPAPNDNGQNDQQRDQQYHNQQQPKQNNQQQKQIKAQEPNFVLQFIMGSACTAGLLWLGIKAYTWYYATPEKKKKDKDKSTTEHAGKKGSYRARSRARRK